jgi:asparagine synthase (glutamine-hydrolysing)
MCGIAGEFRFDNTAPDAATMARMLEKLARRGPDAEGQHADGPVRLGHRRLAIIDLSPRLQQPMSTPSPAPRWCSTAPSTTTPNCVPN